MKSLLLVTDPKKFAEKEISKIFSLVEATRNLHANKNCKRR